MVKFETEATRTLMCVRIFNGGFFWTDQRASHQNYLLGDTFTVVRIIRNEEDANGDAAAGSRCAFVALPAIFC